MRIRDFSGGINKRLDPTLIAPNEAQELINADISSGALCAAKAAKQQALPDGTVLEDHGFYHKKWYPDDTQNSWLTFRDKVYFSKPQGSVPCFFDGNNAKELGITPVSDEDAALIELTGETTRADWAPSTDEIRGGLDNLVLPANLDDQIDNGTAYNAGGALEGIDPTRVIKLQDADSNEQKMYGIIDYKKRISNKLINTIKLHIFYPVNDGNHDIETTLSNINCSDFTFTIKYKTNNSNIRVFALINNESNYIELIKQGDNFHYNGSFYTNVPSELTDGIVHPSTFILINRLPKSKASVPTLHWRTKVEQVASVRRRYILQVFSTYNADDNFQSPTYVYQFDIENKASQIEFIIEDRAQGFHYRLWRVEDLRNNAATRYLGHFSGVSSQDRTITNTRQTLSFTDTRAGQDWATLAGNIAAQPVDTNTLKSYGTYELIQVVLIPSIVPSDSQYAITNVNEDLAIQSVPTLINQILVGNVNIKLSSIPAYNAQTGEVQPTHRYIYRVDNTRPVFTFVGKIEDDETMFIDNYVDSGRILYIYSTNKTFDAAYHRTQLTKETDVGGNITYKLLNSKEIDDTAELTSRTLGGVPSFYWDGLIYEPPTGFSLTPPDAQQFYRHKLELVHTQTTTGSGSELKTIDRYEVYYRLSENLDKIGLELINEDDVSIVGETLNSLRNFTPENVKYLTLYANTFFGVSASNQSILYFSRIGRPHYWPKENFIELEHPIQGLLEVHQGLLIFTLNETYLLTGYNAETFQIAVISKEYGSIPDGHKTMAFARSLPLWITPHGIATYMNGRVEIISRDKLAGEYPWSMAQSTIFINDQYYILFPEGRVLCLDMQYNTRYLEYKFFETPVANYNAYPKSLAIYDNQPAYIIREPDARDADNTVNPPIPAIPDRTQKNGIYLMFKHVSDKLPMRYKGPTFTEGSPATLKNYSFYYISKTGQVEIRLDKDSVTDTPGELISRCDINTDTKKPIPGSKSRAYSITPEFTGTGCVREFYLEPTRETQKDR